MPLKRRAGWLVQTDGRWRPELMRHMPRKLSHALGPKLPAKAKQARVDTMKDFQVWYAVRGEVDAAERRGADCLSHGTGHAERARKALVGKVPRRPPAALHLGCAGE